MQVCPQDSTVDVLGGMEHVMMVVPVNANVDEAQNVAQEYRQQRLERAQFDFMRHFELQHHDRDDNSEHAIAEFLKPVLFHVSILNAKSTTVCPPQEAFRLGLS